MYGGALGSVLIMQTELADADYYYFFMLYSITYINPVVMQLLRFSVIVLFIQYLLGVLYLYYNTPLRL